MDTSFARRSLPALFAALLASLSLVAEASGGTMLPSAAAEYATGVTRICAGALLFDGTHQMGTRADAVAIARAIKASTARRLARVTALPVPPKLRPLSDRWISSQRELAADYARLWVRIFDAVNAANTPAARASLPARVDALVHAPDALKLAANRLERTLHVPDCTGGG